MTVSTNPLSPEEMPYTGRGRRKLTVEQVKEARRNVRAGKESVADVARRLGVEYVTARDMLLGKTYKWVNDNMEDEEEA